MLLQGKFDGSVDPRQLLLGQLQADGVGQLAVELTVELVEQADAGVEQGGEVGSVLCTDRLAAVGDQVVQILGFLEQLVTLLAQFELCQMQIGDLLFQILDQSGRGRLQLLIELIEDAGEQQVALEHLYLFVQVALCLGAAFQPAFGLQVLLHQIVEIGGSADQLLAELMVEFLLFLYQRVIVDGDQFTGLLCGFFGIPQTFGTALLL